ncbi:MAG: hypothetical protein ACXACW_15900 [Candidatus Hodarchaeales archaeon]|jgi:hypothetical protein
MTKNISTIYSKAPFDLMKGEIITHAPTVFSEFGPSRGRKPRMASFYSPKEEILSWKNKHKGETCCLIANGPSIGDIDLNKINCVTFGLNSAWKYKDWTYYCLADTQQVDEYEKERGHISTLKPLFTSNSYLEGAVKIQAHASAVKKFSFDLTEGVYLNNTITCFAIQLAVWMGFKTIYIVGLDLRGDHYGGPTTEQQVNCPCREKHFANHRETFGYIAGLFTGMNLDVEIINLNPKSFCFAFPKQKFESVF